MKKRKEKKNHDADTTLSSAAAIGSWTSDDRQDSEEVLKLTEMITM